MDLLRLSKIWIKSPLFRKWSLILRTHYNTSVKENLIGQKVTVAGWVNSRRDHGGIIL